VADDKDLDPARVDEKKGPNVGAIAGGVIGGIALVGLGAFFWLRKKKRVQEEEEYVIDETMSEKSEGLGMLKSARASTHTVASMASGLSNFIQIAYVPGVTSRSGPTTPNGLIPPVPAIPFGHRDSTTTVQTRHPQSPVDEVFYLVPNRASTFTTHSDFSTPGDRSSVATTIYGQGAQQTVIQPVRAKAAMVTVKSSPNSNASTPEVKQGSFSSSGLTAPPVRRTVVAARSPLINQEPSSPHSNFSVGYQSYETGQEEDKRRSAYSTSKSEVSDSEWGNADEETMSMSKGKSYAQHRMTQSTYLTTTTEIETGSPFSDRHSVQSVDEFNFPLPHGTGMPPASIHSGHSRVASPALSQRTLMLHSPKEPRHKSPFDDTEDDR